MTRPTLNLLIVFLVLVSLSLSACSGAGRGTLKRVQKPSEKELRQAWKNYTVYYRRHIALVYKLKNDRNIILDKSWAEVVSEDMMENSKILDLTWVREIRGNSDEIFGYLVQRNHDTANGKIIDQNTVQIYYHYVRDQGGP